MLCADVRAKKPNSAATSIVKTAMLAEKEIGRGLRCWQLLLESVLVYARCPVRDTCKLGTPDCFRSWRLGRFGDGQGVCELEKHLFVLDGCNSRIVASLRDATSSRSCTCRTKTLFAHTFGDAAIMADRASA